MNTRDLQYFTAVVETKNYTQVAGQFGVAQPTVTQAIQRLEREFDVQLVDVARGRRGMKITRAGQLLYQAADRINHQLALAQKSISQAKRGSIRFGLPPIIGKIYISGLVKSCPPDLLSCLRITDQGSHELLKRLKDGQIDIAILGSMAPINEEGIFVDLVAKRPFTVAVSEQHPLAKKRRVAFGDLANERFINYSDQYFLGQGAGPSKPRRQPDRFGCDQRRAGDRTARIDRSDPGQFLHLGGDPGRLRVKRRRADPSDDSKAPGTLFTRLIVPTQTSATLL